MPYQSRVEHEAARYLMWGELVRRIMDVESCDEAAARRQIAAAESDGELHCFSGLLSVGLNEARFVPLRYNPRADYWLTCTADPSNPDRLTNPNRLNNPQLPEYFTPLFLREDADRIWPANEATPQKAIGETPAQSRARIAREVADWMGRYAAEMPAGHKVSVEVLWQAAKSAFAPVKVARKIVTDALDQYPNIKLQRGEKAAHKDKSPK